MGSFRGHILPGTFFVVFGCWWIPNMFYRYFKYKLHKAPPYKNTTTFPCPYSSKCLLTELESLVKIVLSLIGVVAEFCTGFNDEGFWEGWGNVQHMCMYFFFGINGIIEVSNHVKWDLPVKLDYVTAAIAYGIEGFLFYHHLFGRTPMNIMMHMFLFYAIIGCFITCLMEMILETNVVPGLFRAFFTLLQGTWFCQIAFTLYSPFGTKWDENNHEQIMIVPSIFALHIALLLLIMMAVGTMVRLHIIKYERKLKTKEMLYSSTTLVDLSAEEIQPLNPEENNCFK